MGRKKTKFSKKKIISAIQGSGGIISVVAKRLECDWHTAKKNIENSPEISQIFEEESDRILDVAESVVIQSLQGQDKNLATSTAKWYLTNKGKSRGYGGQDVSLQANVTFVDDIPLED